MLPGIIGDDASIQAIRARAARVISAERPPPILIQGETGTGKTLLARELHTASPRASAPLVTVNCAAIPDNLLEAELFGIERGAFTDAREARAGLIHAAHRGTLFLDEIGHLPLHLQPKLLTVLEEWKVRRVGGTRAEPVDTWLIAATSEDLEHAMAEGRFLRALYHRLAVMTFRVPPLRERPGDVPPLAAQILVGVCRTYGLPPKRLGADALAALGRHTWPGNVRELGNVLERAALLADGPEVTAGMLALTAESTDAAGPAAGVGRYRRKTDDERGELEQALAAAHGNVSEAARLLGIPRNTLRYRLRRHGMLSADAPAVSSPPAAPSAAPPDPPAPDAASPPRSAPAPLRWEKHGVAFLTGATTAGAPPSAAWLEALDDKVELFGGRVVERDEQRLRAVFGLGAVEDGPRRAVLAALTTLKSAPADAPPGGLSFAIDVDEVAVARADGEILLGPDALSRARAVTPAAATDAGVSLGQAAAQAVRRHFRIGERGGRPWIDPEHATASGTHASALHGRAGELLLLESRAAGVAAGGGQIVGVVGPPGIGKSRLVEELRARCPNDRFGFVEARCAAHASAFAYAPIAALVRQLVGLGPAEGAARAFEALQGFADDPASRENVLYLLHVLGFDIPADGFNALAAEVLRVRSFAAVRWLLLRAAATRPLVLVVEDVHWADPTSRDVLDFLADGMGRAHLLLLVTYRPDSEPAFMARPFATRIVLPPLSAPESRGLVAALLPDEPDAGDVIARITERGEGNPLFLEELSLAVRGGQSLSSVPDSLQGILRVRLESLTDVERRLLQVASLLGREAPRPLLEAVWEGPEPLAPVLDALDRAELLYAAAGTHVFKHALIRDVTYDTLLDSDRVRLHERAARALEAAHRDNPSEACELIAYHYARSDDREKAVDLLMLAQTKTYRRFALEQAVQYFHEARARLDTLPETEANLRRRIELLTRHCDAIGYLTRLEEYRAHLDQAIALAQRLDDPAVLAATRARQGFLLWWTGQYAEAIAVLEPNLRFAPDSSADEINAGVWLLWCYGIVGRHESLLALGPRVLERLQARGSIIHRTYAHGAVVWTLAERGQLADAVREGEAALAHAEASGDPAAVSFSAYNASRAHAYRGDFARAEALCELSLRQAVTPLDRIFAQLSLGWVGCRVGRGEAALAHAEAAMRAARATNWPVAFAWCALPDAYVALGRWQDARRALDEALEVATRHGMFATIAAAERRLGEVLLELGEPGAARDHLSRALEAFERMGARYEHALANAALGRLSCRQGEPGAGAALLTAARAALEAMGALADAARIGQTIEQL